MMNRATTLFSVVLAAALCSPVFAEDCDSKRPCNPKDCSINTPCNAAPCPPNRPCDEVVNTSCGRDVKACIPFTNICKTTHVNDPVCEANKKATNATAKLNCEATNRLTRSNCEATNQIAKANCEATNQIANKACEATNLTEKADCERIKLQEKKLCEAGLAGPYSCSAAEVMGQLQTAHQDRLTPGSEFLGALTTPLKKLTGQISWRDTACIASGEGVPYYDSVRSTDDICTIDVRLTSLTIGDQHLPPTGEKFIRLELLAGGKGTAICGQRTIAANIDLVRFTGDVLFDKHPGEKWLEVHVKNDFEVVDRGALVARAVAPATSTAGTSTPPMPSTILPGAYLVVDGDYLTAIAQRAYGKPTWRVVYAANRSLIRNPNLIYPGQILRVP